MQRHADHSRERSRRLARKAVRPAVEGLEERKLLSTTDGGRWTYPQRITYSFVPDGTSIGGVPSNLFQTMNAVAPTAVWEQAVEQAAAVWQQVANVNLALVPDGGQTSGTYGNQQDDSRFGDIRIGAYPQGTTDLAITLLPPPLNGGTLAGDIFFNSSANWQVNGIAYDIETVALHEFGHALGMGESAIQSAVMYGNYIGQKQSLAGDDVGGIQGIYGAVPADPTNNSSFATATDITPYLNQLGQGAGAGVSIASYNDYDYYQVTAPLITNGTLTVTMQSSNLSSLSPRLTIYAGNQSSLGQSVAANVYGATVSYTVNGVVPGQVYYIRCSAANNGPGSNGAYGLEVNFGPYPLGPIAPPNTAVATQPDQQGGAAMPILRDGSSSPHHPLAHLGGKNHKGMVAPPETLQVGNMATKILADPLRAGKHFVASRHRM